MTEIIAKQLKYGAVPTDKLILIEDFENIIIFHTCFGSLVNETLGRLIASLLAGRIGSVLFKVDAYRIIIQVQEKRIELIKEMLFNTDPKYIKAYVEMSLANTELFEWKFIQVAKRFGVISKDAEYGKVSIKRIIQDYVGTPVYKETFRELEIEKLDIEKTAEILENIQSGKIRLVFKAGLSPLGRIGITQKYSDIVGSAKPEKEIFEIFKQRILNTKIRFICLNCGKWDQTFFVKDVEDVVCNRCGGRLLGVTKSNSRKIVRIVGKALRGLPLTENEKKIFKMLERNADMFLSYRKKAAIVLAGRGVGTETARRILSKLHPTEESLFKDVLEAEKTYLRTKKYWKA
jgi:ATP-dependent Lhr-like helicase